MRETCTLLLMHAALLGALGPVAAQSGSRANGYLGGWPEVVTTSCLSAADRAQLGATLSGGSPPILSASTAFELPRHPLAGNLGQDTYIINYVDLNPTPSYGSCSGMT